MIDSIVGYVANTRCRLEGYAKNVVIDSKSRFNKKKLIDGLGNCFEGNSEFPIIIKDSNLMGNIHVRYGTTLLSCSLGTSSTGQIRLDRFVNAHHLNISAGDAIVEIGSFSSIASCSILLTGHDYSKLSTYYLKRHLLSKMDSGEVFYKDKQLRIGHDVWIGENTTIIGGGVIGNGAVIGAGSVVTKDIEPYSVYAGNPAHFIKWRFSEDLINTLMEKKWWDYDIDKLKQLADHSDESVTELLKDGCI